MDFINEGKTGKVKLYDIYEAIYEDCDSALADDFYKGLKPKMNQKKNIDLADAEVQLYIRDFLESHENDYQYDLLKQALEPYYDHEYDLADEDVQESYEVLEEDEYLDENATFEEIIYRMECAEIYEDLYNAAMLIVDPKLQNMVTHTIQQCEDDGDDVEEAYSIVTSDLLDMHINDKNEEFLTEDIDENKNSILSKVFAQYPDIDEEDEDYLNGLSYDELVNELKTRGWDDLLEESKKIKTEDEESKKIKVSKAALQRFENSLRQIKPYSSSYVDAVYDLLKFNFGKDAYVYRCRKDSEMDRAIKELQKIEKIPGVYYDESKGLVSKLIYVSKDFGDYVINYFKNNSNKVAADKGNKEVKEESEENSQEFEYRMLARLKSDCDYYLGNGNRNAEHSLWAKNEDGQIAKMREIYNQLKEKPEWLSEEDINNYAKEMGVVDLPSTTDGTAEKEIQDMLDRSEKRSKELSESYEVWQKYYEDGEIAKPEYVQSFDTFEEAQKFVDGLNEDPNCEAWVKDLNESKKVTEAENMKEVQDEIETALEKSDSTDLEKDQVVGSLNVLKTDEESAIEGYEDFKEETEKVVDQELSNAIDNQMDEIIQDEKDHIEKIDTIQNTLKDNNKEVKEEFLDANINVDTGDISPNLDLGGLGALAGLVASEEEKESTEKLEEDSKFDSIDFEGKIPRVMRFKEHSVVNDNDLYWVTQQFFNEDDVKQFAEAFKETSFNKAYVTVRDLSTYDFDVDMRHKVFVIINKDGSYDMSDYIDTCELDGYDTSLYESKQLKKEDKTIWSSEYNGDETTADEAYQEYLDEFEPTPIQPKPFEQWLEDTFDDWFEAESNAYLEEHPDKDPGKLNDWEIDEIDYQIREKVQKEIESNMDDLKEQYEEYVQEIKDSGIMTKPADKEKWQMSWYEQDAEAQWEVMDENFSSMIWPMIQNQCIDDILIMLGSVGRWNGTFDGGKIIHADEKNIRNIMGDYDEVTVTADDENHISMEFSHHDGTDGMSLYTIPEDLTELAKAMGYEDPDELDNDIRQDYVDMEDLAKNVDKLVPIINKV